VQEGKSGTHVYHVSDEEIIIYQTPKDGPSTFKGLFEEVCERKKEREAKKRRKVEKSQTALGGGVDKQCKLQDFRFWDLNHCDFSTA
jgi:hypothetical protein